MKPVLVIGATGHVGREVVALLTARGERPRVLVRSPERARHLAVSTEAIVGEMADRASLAHAMSGARAVFFVTPNGADEETLGFNVIEAAETAGVERIVYSAAYRFSSSSRLADRMLNWLTGALGPHYRGKLRVADRVLRSAVGHVVLRPSNFFQNDEHTLAALRRGEFIQPFGAKAVNRVDVRDIAVAAVRAIDGAVPDGAYPVVGAVSLTGAACAQVWSRASGLPVRYNGGAVETWLQAVKDELPDEVRADWAKTFRLLSIFGLSPGPRERALTAQVLGRAPTAYDRYVADQVESWQCRAA